MAELVDWFFIDPKEFEYPSEASHITLISPMIFIPQFVHRYKCRRNYEIFWNNNKSNKIR
jgi:hypothetical protein